MNTQKAATHIDSLYEVRKLIAEVLPALDQSNSDCATCHHNRATNWDEYQAFQALETAVSRIAKAMTLIRLSAQKAEYGVETGTELVEAQTLQRELNALEASKLDELAAIERPRNTVFLGKSSDTEPE